VEKSITLDNIDIFATFQEIPLFSGISDEDLWEVAKRTKVYEYRKGDNIIREGETEAAHLYIMINGNGVVSHSGQKIESLEQNSFYGEYELIAGKEYYSNSIRLITPTAQFLKLSRKIFISLFENNSSMSQNICRLASDKYLMHTHSLAVERKKSNNIDSILARFDQVSKEILKAVGREEVEVKYLLKNSFSIKELDKYNLEYQSIEIEQVYLSIEKSSEERIRKYGDKYIRTIKEGEGKVRNEKDWVIDRQTFEKEASERTIGNMIKKMRYVFKNDDFKEICIDKYDANLSPLKVAEITFLSFSDSINFNMPSWLKKFIKKEVTEDKRYKNKNLALDGLPKELI